MQRKRGSKSAWHKVNIPSFKLMYKWIQEKDSSWGTAAKMQRMWNTDKGDKSQNFLYISKLLSGGRSGTKLHFKELAWSFNCSLTPKVIKTVVRHTALWLRAQALKLNYWTYFPDPLLTSPVNKRCLPQFPHLQNKAPIPKGCNWISACTRVNFITIVKYINKITLKERGSTLMRKGKKIGMKGKGET